MTVILAVLLLYPGTVSAHAYIVKSSPAENEALQKPPAKIDIYFNEPLQKAFHAIKVTDSAGKTVNASESRFPEGENSALEADLQPNLPNGIYAVRGKRYRPTGTPSKEPIRSGSVKAAAVRPGPKRSCPPVGPAPT